MNDAIEDSMNICKKLEITENALKKVEGNFEVIAVERIPQSPTTESLCCKTVQKLSIENWLQNIEMPDNGIGHWDSTDLVLYSETPHEENTPKDGSECEDVVAIQDVEMVTYLNVKLSKTYLKIERFSSSENSSDGDFYCKEETESTQVSLSRNEDDRKSSFDVDHDEMILKNPDLKQNVSKDNDEDTPLSMNGHLIPGISTSRKTDDLIARVDEYLERKKAEASAQQAGVASAKKETRWRRVLSSLRNRADAVRKFFICGARISGD